MIEQITTEPTRIRAGENFKIKVKVTEYNTDISQGEELILTDSKENGKTKFIFKGQTEQTQYQGYNLINGNLYEGITVTENANYAINELNLKAGDLTFWSTIGIYVSFRNSSNVEVTNISFNAITGVKNFSLTQEQINEISIIKIFPYSGSSELGAWYFMCVSGTYTLQTIPNYEKYVGGTASPNPSFPQIIHTVTGENSVKIQNKNLYYNTITDTSGSSNGIDWVKNNDGSFTLNGTATAQFTLIMADYTMLFKQLINGEEYTLSGCPDGGSSSTYRLQIYNYGQTMYDTGNGVSGVANLQSGCNVAIRVYSGVECNNLTFKPMIEKGSTASTYIQHAEQNYTITLPTGMELCKIGDYQDYIYKNGDNWYKHKSIGKVVLNGTETGWERGNTNTTGLYRFSNSSLSSIIRHATDNNEVAPVYSDVFIAITPSQTYSNKNGISISTNGNILIYLDEVSEYSLNSFKTWLGTNNATLYYPLVTPVEELITDTTLINQLNQIHSAYTYLEQTIITQTNNGLPFILDVMWEVIENE